MCVWRFHGPDWVDWLGWTRLARMESPALRASGDSMALVSASKTPPTAHAASRPKRPRIASPACLRRSVQPQSIDPPDSQPPKKRYRIASPCDGTRVVALPDTDTPLLTLTMRNRKLPQYSFAPVGHMAVLLQNWQVDGRWKSGSM
jgi:hypothetical protein